MKPALLADILRRIAKLVSKHPKEAVVVLKMLADFVENVEKVKGI